MERVHISQEMTTPKATKECHVSPVAPSPPLLCGKVGDDVDRGSGDVIKTHI